MTSRPQEGCLAVHERINATGLHYSDLPFFSPTRQSMVSNRDNGALDRYRGKSGTDTGGPMAPSPSPAAVKCKPVVAWVNMAASLGAKLGALTSTCDPRRHGMLQNLASRSMPLLLPFPLRCPFSNCPCNDYFSLFFYQNRRSAQNRG